MLQSSKRKPATKARKSNGEFHQYKNCMEAWQAADEFCREHTIDNLRFFGCETKQDVRDWVMFNMLRNIDEALNPSIEQEYLRRIQQNFFHSTFK